MNNANVFKMKKMFELRLDYIIPSLMFLEEGFLEQMIGRKTKLSVKKKKFGNLERTTSTPPLDPPL